MGPATTTTRRVSVVSDKQSLASSINNRPHGSLLYHGEKEWEWAMGKQIRKRIKNQGERRIKIRPRSVINDQ